MTDNGKNGHKRWIGQPLPRKEESRLLRGQGKFIDDIKLRDMMYLQFVRSPYAHASIRSVETSAAEALPGLVAVVTGKEIEASTSPFIEIGPDQCQKIADFPMAGSKVRYQGEPVAAVVAATPQIAADAAELIQVDYEPLTPITDAEEALKKGSILHDGMATNLVWRGVFEYGDVKRAFAE